MLTLPALARRRRRPDADDWQRTDGGVYVPRVPLRGGIVRRGMGFGFEPAGCCCVAEGCGPYGPMAYDFTGQSLLVEFSGITGPGDCSLGNSQFEIPVETYSTTSPCYVQWQEYYTTYPHTPAPGIHRVGASFWVERAEYNTRELFVWIYLYCGQAYWGMVNLQFKENTKSRWDNSPGATWSLSDLYNSYDCDGSGATATVTIG